MVSKRLSDKEKRDIVATLTIDLNLYAKRDAQSASPGEAFSFQASHKPGDDSDVDVLACVGDSLFSVADMKGFTIEAIDHKDSGVWLTVKPKDPSYTGRVFKDSPIILVQGVADELIK